MLSLTSGLGAIHRRPSAGLARRCFVQYGRAPDLAPLRTSFLELENSPLGHLLTGGPRVRIPFAPPASQAPNPSRVAVEWPVGLRTRPCAVRPPGPRGCGR